MSILDRVRTHARPDELREILVPEWGEGGEPLVIRHHMVTMGDMEQARSAAPGNPLRQQVEIICMKALDTAGKPLFRRVDALELMQVGDPAVLLRIANQMVPSASLEEKEKN